MKISLNGVIRIEDYTQEIVEFLNDNLVIENKEYQKLMKLHLPNYRHIKPTINLFAIVGNICYLPFGFFNELCIYLFNKNLYSSVEFINNTVDKEEANITDTIKLYDYQEKCVNEVLKHKNGIIKAKCGSGKTLMALKLISKLNKKTLWITHTHTLLKQTKEVASNVLKCDIGTITEGKVNIGKDLTIATIQTLYRMDLSLIKNYFSVIVIDEAHRFLGTDYTKYNMATKVLSNLNARYRYGLTATPKDDNKNDFTCLKALLGDIIYTIENKDIKDKIINATLELVETKCYLELEKITNLDGTFNYNNFLNEISHNEVRNKNIAKKINYYFHLDKKQIVLCLRLEQVDNIVEMVRNLYPSIKVASTNESDKISKNYNCLVATYQKIKEGFDDKELDVLHMVAPVKDKVSIVQSIGRIERNYKGKEKPLALYYLDNVSYSLSCYKKIKKILKENEL